MNIYEYNSSSIIYYTTEDLGSIADTPMATVDNGSLDAAENSVNYDQIIYTETTYPFGTVKLISSTKSSATVKFVASVEIKLDGISKNNVRKYWIGSGTLFEIGNGLERTVAPWVGSSGPLRISGACTDFAIYSYNDSSIELYGSDDYGYINDLQNSAINNGSVSINLQGIEDNGSIVISQDTYPHGLYSTSGSCGVIFKPSFAQVGRAYINVSGFATNTRYTASWKSKDSSPNILSGTLQEKYCKANYDGSGVLFTVGDKKERAIYRYDSESVIGYNETDYGFITASGITVDYGSINDHQTGGEIDYNLIINSDYDYPLNPLFTFSGEALSDYKPVFTQIGSGGFKFTHQPSPTDTRFFPWWRGVGGISVFNSVIPDAFSRPYIGKGNLFSFGDKVESKTYDYNSSSVVFFSTEDYGNIVSSGITVDYGYVSEPNVGITDYSSILILDVEYPLNVLYTFSGEGDGQFIRGPYSGKGRINLDGSGIEKNTENWAGAGNVSIYGSGVEKNTESYVGTGSLFHIGDRVEKATYSYNSSAISGYDETDYGFITASGVSLDHGFVYENASQGEVDYGNVIDLDITYPYGLFSISGQSSDRWIQVFTKVGSGSLFEFNGATEAFSAQTPENTFLYNITGNSADSKTKIFTGSGSLFSIGDRVERATYSYNESSIVAYGPEVDYGSIVSSGTTVDYGYVSQVVTEGEIDNGSLVILDYDYPVNVLFKFTGEGATELKPSFNWKGRGGFTFHHQPLGSDIRFRPWWRSVGGLEIYGDSADSKANRYIGEGNLFSFGDRVESRTYDYNTSSVVFFSAEDYGLITASGVPVDYGYVTEPNVGITDYSSILILDAEYPLNLLYRFTGEGQGQFIRGPYTGRGQINLDGSLIERQSDAWLGVSNISISGDGLENRIKTYIGTGSLFHIGDRVEKATYSYNSSSVSGYDQTDYGFITASGVSVDFGYVSQTPTAGEVDYGNVIDLDITYPYGLFNISGQSSDRWIQVFTKVGSGSLFEFNGASEAFSAQTPENTFLYTVSGNGADSFSRPYIGSGSLFHIGERVERATYAYNTSSIIDPYQSTDYGDLGTASSNIDYGLIDSVVDSGEIDYGNITLISGEEKPFGLFRISGIANTPFDRFYSGTGSLFAISNTAEAFSAQTPENTFLYTFSGSAGTPRTRPFIASGSASFSGYITEKHTEAYQGTGSLAFEERFPAASVVNTESYVGSGTITLSTGKFPEFRNYRPTPRYVNSIYGEIGGQLNVSGDGVTKPIAVFTEVGSGSLFTTGTKVERATNAWVGTGNINVSGTADTDRARAYAGTGFFSILKGSAESFSAQTPENTFLYRFSGSATEKNTERFIGAGTLFSAGSAAETIVISAPTPTGLFSVSGSAIPVIILSHYGSGSLFTYSESSSKVTFNPVENTVLYEISGSASTRRTDTYIGAGTLDLTGTAVEKNTEDYAGSGNLFSLGISESSVVFNPSENTVLFRIFGSATEKNVENYAGSGNLFAIGKSTSSVTFNPVEQRADYVISGAVSEQLIKSYRGLGSLFTFNGSSESATYNPTENTVLYNISGSATVKHTERYVGAVDITVSGSAAEKHVEKYVGVGQFNISGAGTEKHVEKYVGSGDISISGTKDISFAKAPYAGSGTLVAFKGASESFVANVPEETVLFRFTGNVTEKHTERFIGSGSETISGSATERHTESYVGKGTETISGSATTSFIAQTPENVILFRISGAAKTNFTTRYNGSGRETIFGYITERQTDSYKGSGSLFGIGNTAYSRIITQKTDARTSLFKISGDSTNNYSRISVTNKFNIKVSGASRDTVILFSPARIFGTII